MSPQFQKSQHGSFTTARADLKLGAFTEQLVAYGQRHQFAASLDSAPAKNETTPRIR